MLSCYYQLFINWVKQICFANGEIFIIGYKKSNNPSKKKDNTVVTIFIKKWEL